MMEISEELGYINPPKRVKQKNYFEYKTTCKPSSYADFFTEDEE